MNVESNGEKEKSTSELNANHGNLGRFE